MTEIERYKKLKLELEDVSGKLVGLPGRVNALRMESAAARDEAVRAELLGDSGAAGKRAMIQRAQDEVRKVEAEREDLGHRREILLSVMEEVRKKAEAELGAFHTRQYTKAARAFAVALRAAHKAELELFLTKEEADRAFVDIDSRLVPLPLLTPILIRSAGTPEAWQPTLERFFDQMKGQGFDLS